MRKSYRLAWRDGVLELGQRTCVMGVVNVTPDSFSDGGLFYSDDEAIHQGLKLAREGADIIDVGGESTRPYSDPVSAEEEIRRVVPVIRALTQSLSIPISIDTTKAEVARQAIENGAAIINDIGALRLDPEMVRVAARYRVPVILMHMKGSPKTMQVSPSYEDLLEEVRRFLEESVELAVGNGVERSSLIVDPGIGFGKTVHHNLMLIRHLEKIAILDLPVLMGPSRKSFIRKLLCDPHCRDEVQLVEAGTQAAVAASVLYGAHIVRVHDVASTRATVEMMDAILNSNSEKSGVRCQVSGVSAGGESET